MQSILASLLFAATLMQPVLAHGSRFQPLNFTFDVVVSGANKPSVNISCYEDRDTILANTNVITDVLKTFSNIQCAEGVVISSSPASTLLSVPQGYYIEDKKYEYSGDGRDMTTATLRPTAKDLCSYPGQSFGSLTRFLYKVSKSAGVTSLSVDYVDVLHGDYFHFQIACYFPSLYNAQVLKFKRGQFPKDGVDLSKYNDYPSTWTCRNNGNTKIDWYGTRDAYTDMTSYQKVIVPETNCKPCQMTPLKNPDGSISKDYVPCNQPPKF